MSFKKIFFLVFLEPHQWLMEVPRLGVQLELELLAIFCPPPVQSFFCSLDSLDPSHSDPLPFSLLQRDKSPALFSLKADLLCSKLQSIMKKTRSSRPGLTTDSQPPGSATSSFLLSTSFCFCSTPSPGPPGCYCNVSLFSSYSPPCTLHLTLNNGSLRKSTLSD